MKLLIIFLLNDGNSVCYSRQLEPSASVAQAVADAAKDPEVAAQLSNITKAIRILGSTVFVDDREKILWMMGIKDEGHPVLPSHVPIVRETHLKGSTVSVS